MPANRARKVSTDDNDGPDNNDATLGMKGPDARRFVVCHFTSVHVFDDVRIFQKECKSLARQFEVHLVAVGAPEGVFEGVTMHPVPARWRSRLGRMINGPWRVAKVLRSIDADVYHFHDPEMIPVGLWLRARGKRVVYDAHEDLPRELCSKRYLKQLRHLLPWPVEVMEDAASRRFSAVVTATPFIGLRFAKINPRTVVVNNYPLRDQLVVSDPVPLSVRPPTLAYVGVISAHRGLFQMINAVERVNERMPVTLELAGIFDDPQTYATAIALPGWHHVRELGQVPRAQVAALLARSRAGMVLFQPAPNHINSQPNKLFEYMSAGLPVIGSHFPLWKDLFSSCGSGLAVDPENVEEIADAIEFILSHPDEAETMGRSGRDAVTAWCNWERESEKLHELYRDLCAS
jgi:glycosyltransferase involved in cell wall biosynthesis